MGSCIQTFGIAVQSVGLENWLCPWLLHLIKRARKDPPYLTSWMHMFNGWEAGRASGWMEEIWMCLLCGVLLSVYEVNRVRRSCWQGCLLTLSTQAQVSCRRTRRCHTAAGPRSKLRPGHGPNRPQLSCKEENGKWFFRSDFFNNCIEQ